MKVWIGSRTSDTVSVFPRKPKAEWWSRSRKEWCPVGLRAISREPATICREVIGRLLRGAGKELPKVDSNELVGIEIFAK